MIREFRQETRTKRVNRWRVWRDKAQVSFQDGLVSGKLKIATTHTFDKPLNKGKANEKSADQQSIEFMERQILLKTRKGYREVDPKNGEFLQYAPEKSDTLTIFSKIPRELRFYKPLNSMNTYMEKKMNERKAMWLRKRDGCMHFYVIDEKGQHRMYSSTSTPHQKDEPEIEIIERYQQVKMAVTNLKCIPKNTILLGEVCCVAAGGYVDKQGYDVDDRDIVNGVRGAKLDEAIRIQQEHGGLGFCIWDIGFWDGSCLPQVVPSGDRQGKVRSLVEKDDTGWLTYPEYCEYDEANDHVIMKSPNSIGDFHFDQGENIRRTLLDVASQLNWEGWVVVDPDSTFDDRTYNFRGKNDRPKFCAKDKPKMEADFIVRWDPDNDIGKKGKGRKSVGVGSVQAYLWHPEKGEVPVALVGGGLDDKQVIEFADPDLYPMVWQVEFEDWTKIGSLTHPRLMWPRDDKTTEECGVDQNPDWEKHYGG